jgi:hypothetical protein
VALVGDAGSVFTNPAGLATISHLALEAGYRPVEPSGFVGSGALAWRLRQLNLGGGVQYVDFGGGTAGGSDHQLVGVGSLVYRVGLLALGASARGARRVTAGRTDTGISGDIGVAIAVFDIMALAFSVQNVSGNWERASALALPRTTRAGFTMNYTDPQESFRLLSTIEVQWPEGTGARLVLGGEGGLVVGGVGLIARAAYGSRPASGGSRLAFGGSVALARVLLDYARESATTTAGESRHRFGMRFTW